MIYTGQPGYEIGLLDYVNKRVLLFDKTTGVISASVQLPASAVTTNAHNFSYANNRVWLYNNSFRTWYAYNIWPTSLPVHLLSFTAMQKDNKVLCEWTTASEVNNDYFTLERSTNGTDFSIVATVDGAGESNHSIHYEAVDESPFTGIAYYRLKQTDYDGAYTYSRIVAVNVHKKNELSVFPNPAVNKIMVQLSLPEPGELHLKIADHTGRIVYSERKVMDAGCLIHEMKLSSLPRGIYTLQIQSSSDSQHTCFVLN